MNICVDKLSFSYGSRQVLRNVSLEARGGELVSILGANAVGKSSLFKCMLGLKSGWTGDVTIDGRSIQSMSTAEISRHIAYIPQSTSPSFNYSVEDIVLMGTTAGSSVFRTPKGEELRRVDTALRKTGIEHLRHRCFHHLSGGERQLVIIARALAQNAGILMPDEPTSALDFGNQLLVLRQLRSLADEGYAVIQTTHNPEHSYIFSDRIIALKGGRVIASGTPQEVITPEIIGALYGTEVRISSLDNDSVRVCLPADL